MGAKHNKCCCLGASGESLIVGSRKNLSGFARIFKYELDGTLFGILWDESSGTSATGAMEVACDNSGNIYIATGGSNKVVSLDSSGTLRWTFTDPSFNGVYSVCVDAFEHVYLANFVGVVRKLNSNTGVEITSGWPQSDSPIYGDPKVIVDQSGNVYLNCSRVGDPGAKNLFSWTGAGATRWGVQIGSNSTAAAGLAINAANDELTACRQYISTSPAATEYVVNPANGSLISSRTDAQAFDSKHGAAYDKDGNRFVLSAIGTIYKNGSLFVDLATQNRGITCDRTSGNIYVARTKPPANPKYSVMARDSTAAFLWGADPSGSDYPGTALAQSVESSIGRIGAFGL